MVIFGIGDILGVAKIDIDTVTDIDTGFVIGIAFFQNPSIDIGIDFFQNPSIDIGIDFF